MLFRLGPPLNSLSDSDLILGGWKPLRQLPFWLFQLCGILTGVIAAIATLILWKQFRPAYSPEFAAPWQIVGTVMIAVLFAGLILQVAAHPGYGLTDKTTLGIWVTRLTPYTYFDGVFSKRRYIFALLMPVTVLVVFPFLSAALSGWNSGWFIFISCSGAFFLVQVFFWHCPPHCNFLRERA
ncbi:hypothetical protein GM658_28490 [Pseudoduganella eburnea]|uniref:Uncharacterized protein n=1 Tax=Massilia eburnea TaxID=1776165 RepID=A0A6L6QQA9_9BURK|nr:hypothetical protein [Massilia eburnea]MTW14559.1 hypothetical protein [Massilia eburnea]